MNIASRWLPRPSLLPFLLLTIILVPSAASAATPNSGTVDGATARQTWCGSTGCSALINSATTDQLGSGNCSNSTCDLYTLTIGSVPAGQQVTISVQWTNPANDLDMYIYDSAGNLVGSSAGPIPGTIEATSIPAKPGTYTVSVLEFRMAADNYVGSATLGPAPAPPVPSYLTGGITFSPNVTVKAPGAARDGEPSNRTDYLGNAYVSGIRGFPAGVDLWSFNLAPGSPAFDPNMRNATYRGQPDSFTPENTLDVGGDGGGDVDLAVGFQPPTFTSTGLPNLSVVSLIAANISASRSQDAGASFLKDPAGSYIPADDRQWIEAYKGDVVFLFYRAPIPLTQLWLAVSTDGGLTYPVTSLVSSGGTTPGYIAVDQNTGWVYVGHASAAALFVSRTRFDPANPNAPLTFQTITVDNTTSHRHLFDVVKVGRDGTVYALWSDEHTIWYSYSTDNGLTWSGKGQVNNPSFATADRFGAQQTVKTNLMPWMEAGTAGRVDFVWFGTTEASNSDNADWNVFFAQATAANTGNPVIRQAKASDHFIHAGNISEMGLGGNANRNLLDYFQVSLDPQGAAVIAYADDHNDFSGHTYVTRQLSGPSAYSGANGNGTVKSVSPAPIPAQDPAAPQVADFRNDTIVYTATLPGDNAWDITSIRYGCQATVDGGTLLTTAMGVSSLVAIPPNSNWRVNFSANAVARLADRGDQFFLQASTGTTTATFTWGTAVRNPDGSITYTTRGAADVGYFDTGLNRIVMKVNLAQLNQFAGTPLAAGSRLIGLRGSTWTISQSVSGVPVLGSVGVTIPRDITRGGSIPVGQPYQGDHTAGIAEASFTIGNCEGASIQPPPPPPPGTPAVSSQSGAGKFDLSGGEAAFEFEVQNDPSGHLRFADKSANLDLVSSTIDFFEPPQGDKCVSFGGHGRLNGDPNHIFTVKACDNGNGGQSDTFTISIDANYSATGTLKSGNLNTHEK